MLSCGHDGMPFGEPLCTHIRVTREGCLSCVRWYTGRGLDSERLCGDCAAARRRGETVDVARVCEACFATATEDFSEVSSIGGQPEIRARDEPMSKTTVRSTFPDSIGPVVGAAPINGLSGAQWLVLASDGALVRFDADSGACEQLCTLKTQGATPVEPWWNNGNARLHVSERGQFAAVVNDYGRDGKIVDLRTGTTTTSLEGGDYKSYTVPFAFAFVDTDDRTLAIHRTKWNRLDVSDAATGKVLTTRESPLRSPGGPDPAHYLDYFHGALVVSPHGRRVLDDGWIWHQVGDPTAWNVERWIADNVWESEDGESRRRLAWRSYYWNRGGCWLDDARVAITGIGDDDEAMLDGALIFDIAALAKAGRFLEPAMTMPGPAGTLFSDGVSLFSANAKGLSRWSLSDGALTGHIAGFQPGYHHRGAGELVQRDGSALIRWLIG